MRLKNLEGKSERESPKKTISTSGGLELFQLVQSQTPSDVPVRRMSPEGGLDTRRCTNKDAGLRRGWIGVEEGNECQLGRWAPKARGL